MTDSNSNYSDLPLGWKIVQLQDIAEINPKLPYTDLDDSLTVSFLPMASVEEVSGKYDLSQTRLYGEVKKGYTAFINGDIIFAKITPCMENGKIAIVENLQNGIGFGSTEFHVSRIKLGLNKRYLFYYFTQASFKREARRNMTGSAGQLRVPKKYFESVEIPLPPLPEQHRIVEKIEELFSELDNGVASLKKALEQLKTYRQAVLKWAFEGKLTEKWRNTHQDSLEDGDTLLEQIKAERKRHYQQQLEDWKQALKEWENNGKETKKPTAPRKQEYYSPLKQEETNKLWKIPDKWTWEKVGNICQSIVPNRDKPKSFSGNIPWITTPDIDSDLITLKLLPNHLGLNINEVELYNARVIPKNSVIMTCVGSFGIVCINTISCVINQQLHAFMTHSYINNKYLAYALKIQQSWMEKKSTSTTVVYLNKTNSNSVPIPLCSLQEQTKIVQEIESRLSICDQLEATLTENLDKAEALRQSILKRAFEGKLVL
ncbi:restriction endonuclease subunit S [Microcystis aeruginosa]|uniref:restriction endonuclease subunit S n=1 Tax=Microcystis aeruginosa TaxID=1126 RepID=UPI000261C707|nr:restriction endonuclease subunit S [Microcystis aeruginosa]CCI05905.1 Restriction modification system DNA specificity protein [Microcystis aeruginosa PCC 7941]